VTLLDNALSRLRQEFVDSGRESQIEAQGAPGRG
jgi:hypothetical protein